MNWKRIEEMVVESRFGNHNRSKVSMHFQALGWRVSRNVAGQGVLTFRNCFESIYRVHQ